MGMILPGTPRYKLWRPGFWLLCALFMSPLQAQTADLTGIAHVAFRVSDVAKSREFYNRLGFEKAFEFGDGGKTSVAFIKVNDRQFIELYPRTTNPQPIGLMHVCFEANDIESVHSRYLQHGLQPAEIKKARAGNLLFVVHDPEGQLLEFTQYMPDSLHSQDRGKHMTPRRISSHLLEATSPVKDNAAEGEYYAAKLGFERAASSQTEFFVTDTSGDKVALQTQAQMQQARIVFGVPNLKETAHRLRRRGFKSQPNQGAISIVDPDGTVLTFALEPESSKK